MVQAAERLKRKSPRGSVRCICERAFAQLSDALDAGVAVPFPAVCGTVGFVRSNAPVGKQ